MATRGANGRTGEAQRTAFRPATLHGSESDTRLTITTALDAYDFPNDPGTEVRVELVEYEDESNRLEVIPCEDDERE